MNAKLLSIITPTKDRATTYLPDLISSVEDQELSEGWKVEMIIYDDGSTATEKTALDDLAAGSSLDIRVIHGAESIGPAAGRNAAAKASVGSLLIDVDDDDTLPSGTLVSRIAFMEKTGALWAAGNAHVMDEAGTVIPAKALVRSWDQQAMSRAELMRALLTNQAWFWAGTRTYRREALFDDRGALREWRIEYIVAQDLDHWVRLVHEIGPPAYMDEFVINWREKQDSHAINAVRSGLQAEMITRIRRYWEPILHEIEATGSPKIAVVMCTYKRPERIAVTLQQLLSQVGCTPELYVWNNNPEISSEILDAVTAHSLPVHIHNSTENIGGFGRFYQAKKLASRFKYIVMIDDDVDLGYNALETLLAEAQPRTVLSFFAYRLSSPIDYFDRRPGMIGDTVDYCGTGGMVIDSSIFREPKLFECPKEFWFLEDLWLCYVARTLGWKLEKSGVDIKLVAGDYKDQWLTLKKKKSEFLVYLIKQGFTISGPVES